MNNQSAVLHEEIVDATNYAGGMVLANMVVNGDELATEDLSKVVFTSQSTSV